MNLKKEMRKKKKLKRLAEVDQGTPRPYLSIMGIDKAWMAVWIEIDMVDCAGNMRNKYKGRMLYVACSARC